METKEEEWLQFIDTLSHELKTPLTSIIAAAGLLAEELESTSDESFQKLSQTIIHNSNILQTRLAELMDIVKTRSGKLQLQFEPVDMRSLLQGIGWQMSPLLQTKKLKIHMELPPSLPIIRGDGQRLEQVVLNLATNAVKFTPEGGNITLWAQKRDNELLVAVRDDGIGIAQNEQARLFQPYSRLNADRQRYPGLGLGLALARQVVELHGGKIWVESTPGQGSAFFFSLPLDTRK